MIPGYWMLFVMDRDGVPSIAKIMMIGLDSRKTIQPAEELLSEMDEQKCEHELLQHLGNFCSQY